MKCLCILVVVNFLAQVKGDFGNYRDNVTCPESTDDGFPSFVPNPTNCDQYYICLQGEPKLQDCPEGLWFDPSVNVCNWPDAVVPHCAADCKEPWNRSDNVSKCYLTGKKKMFYNKAKKYCEKHGGILAEPRSTEETDAINQIIDDGWEYWIGLTDRVVEGTFVWDSDNSIPEYDNWRIGEPNNKGWENCVHLTSREPDSESQQPKGTWNDLDCTWKRLDKKKRRITALCEK